MGEIAIQGCRYPLPLVQGKVVAISWVEPWEVRDGGKGTLGKVSLNPEGQRALTIIGA